MYFGPETMMPLASAAAAVGGMLLIFWRRLVGWARMTVRWVKGLRRRLGNEER